VNTRYALVVFPPNSCFVSAEFPDSVRLIDLVGDAAALQEGSVRMMRCAIEAVAPAHNISVTLYVGNRAVLKRDGFSGGAKPMDLQAVFSYKPRREDNGHNMSCRVTFDLGPSGPTQAFSSQQHPLTVLCKYGDSASSSTCYIMLFI